jgi:hypothetical protein
MLLHQVALVSEMREVSASEVTRVAAALQKQASRDFAPLWEVNATVDAFVKLDDVPLGYWPVIVMKNIQQSGAAGVHLDKDGQPFALVQYDESWTLTASHECLEMLADPFGNRLIAGASPKKGQGRVEFLVEVCDPCEDASQAYTVNEVVVSDFVTPHFYDPVASNGVRYSFGGNLQRPRDVLEGGYLSWLHPPTKHWWQLTFFGTKKTFRDLGVFERQPRSLREEIDRLTPMEEEKVSRRSAATRRHLASMPEASSHSKAEEWRAEIAQLTKGRAAI